MIEILLNKPAANRILDAIVAEHGDFVYRRNHDACVYINDYSKYPAAHSSPPAGTPMRCIVGEVLSRAGVPDEVLVYLDGNIDHDLFVTLNDVAIGRGMTLTARATDPAIELLAVAQNWQDSWMVTWAEAVKMARESTVNLFAPHTEKVAALLAVLGREPESVG